MARREMMVYQFKIILENIEPVIWRRIQVPDFYDFWDLHVAIQDAMGWEDRHLHEFRIKTARKRVVIGIPPDEDDWPEEIPTKAGWEIKMKKYFTAKGAEAIYLYDFGDGWRHQIILEEILPRDFGKRYPRCLEGERAGPPEDCGGPWGYEELLQIVKTPNHSRHKELKRWLGKYDPEDFRADAVKFDDPTDRFYIAFPEGDEE